MDRKKKASVRKDLITKKELDELVKSVRWASDVLHRIVANGTVHDSEFTCFKGQCIRCDAIEEVRRVIGGVIKGFSH